jgi:hypothetical protein
MKVWLLLLFLLLLLMMMVQPLPLVGHWLLAEATMLLGQLLFHRAQVCVTTA